MSISLHNGCHWRRASDGERWAEHISMKTTLLAILTSSLIGGVCLAGDAPLKSPPRYKARVVCFNGKIDSRSSCSATNFQPDGTVHTTGKLSCGHPGKVSEIEWWFVEQHGDKDVYRFTRRFPTDATAVASSSKTVEFSTSRVTVFEDKFQTITIEPPKK